MTISQYRLNRREQRKQRKPNSLLPLLPPVQNALVAALWAAALLRSASAQCYVDPYTGQQICARPQEIGVPSAEASAHCRITVGDGSTGSGTLVARNERAGLVLTCSHLFDRTTNNVTVAFADGQRFAARVLERDRPHDLAALVIHRPDIEPIAVLQNDGDIAGVVSACGFGANGEFRCVRGNITGQATPVGAVHPALTIRGAVRPGDSGGAVLNPSGQLVGVVWGELDGLTYATCGRPLRELLRRVIGNESPAADAAPGIANGSAAWTKLNSQIAALDARLRDLDRAKQDKGEYVSRGDLGDYVRHDDLPTRFESIHKRIEAVRENVAKVAVGKVGFFHGLSFGKLLAGALGLSGPLAAAVVIAGGLAGRRAKQAVKRAGGPAGSLCADSTPVAVDTPPPPQRTVNETHYIPYEIDSFAKAHQWASEQVARKYPGATELLQAQDSLIKQFLTAQRHT